MLILTRRVGEAVQIGDNITIRVLGVKGGQVRLGFDVPKDVNVMRTELLNKPKKLISLLCKNNCLLILRINKRIN